MAARTTTGPNRQPLALDSGAEKVAVLRTATYFAERRGRADWEAFDRMMGRQGGQPPRPGDELPER